MICMFAWGLDIHAPRHARAQHVALAFEDSGSNALRHIDCWAALREDGLRIARAGVAALLAYNKMRVIDIEVAHELRPLLLLRSVVLGAATTLAARCDPQDS